MCPTYQISIMLRFKRHSRKIQDDQKKWFSKCACFGDIFTRCGLKASLETESQKQSCLLFFDRMFIFSATKVLFTLPWPRFADINFPKTSDCKCLFKTFPFLINSARRGGIFKLGAKYIGRVFKLRGCCCDIFLRLILRGLVKKTDITYQSLHGLHDNLEPCQLVIAAMLLPCRRRRTSQHPFYKCIYRQIRRRPFPLLEMLTQRVLSVLAVFSKE